MRSVIVQLPDSVALSEAEIQQLVLAKVAEREGQESRPEAADVAALLGRPVPAADVADLRHLIGLYYAERATRLVDAQWADQGWTPDTMQEWLGEHLRTAHGRPAA